MCFPALSNYCIVFLRLVPDGISCNFPRLVMLACSRAPTAPVSDWLLVVSTWVLLIQDVDLTMVTTIAIPEKIRGCLFSSGK